MCKLSSMAQTPSFCPFSSISLPHWRVHCCVWCLMCAFHPSALLQSRLSFLAPCSNKQYSISPPSWNQFFLWGSKKKKKTHIASRKISGTTKIPTQLTNNVITHRTHLTLISPIFDNSARATRDTCPFSPGHVHRTRNWKPPLLLPTKHHYFNYY